MKKIKKLCAFILVVATAFSLFVTPISTSALDNDSRYALTITSPCDGAVIDPTETLTIKWKAYKDADSHWIALLGDDGNYVFNGEVYGTSLKIKNGLNYSTTYKLFIEARKDGQRMHSGSAWQVHYFNTCEEYSPCGLLEGFPELLLDHGKYIHVDGITYYSVVDEYIAPNKKLRLEWICSEDDIIDYTQVYVKLLDGAPDPESNNEAGKLLYSKETSRDYLTISKSKIRNCDQSWIKVSLQGCTDSMDAYTSIRNYYIWIGDPAEKDEVEEISKYPTCDDEGNTFADYTGVDYLSELNRLYKDAVISEREYKNRISICENARYMCTLIWEAPFDIHTWKGSDGSYNSNYAMLVSGTMKEEYIFSAGNTYVGIPYSMNPKGNKNGVDEWVAILNSTVKTSDLEGNVNGRSATTLVGIDCSGLIYKSYADLHQPVPYLCTKDMLKSSKWTMLASTTDLLPGDILLKDGHVMLYIGKLDKQYFVFESTAYSPYSGCRYYSHTDVSTYGAYRYLYIDK